MRQTKNQLLVIAVSCIFLIDSIACADSLLDAYFRHREAHKAISNHILATNGRNSFDDYDLADTRQPGSFVKLHETESRKWDEQPVKYSPNRNDMSAAAFIQKIRGGGFHHLVSG